MKLATMLVLTIFTCAVTGCGGNPNLADVSGVITLDGKPLPKAMVTFTPNSGGATSYGKSDDNGYYRMIFSDSQSGAWIGMSRVTIRTGDVLPDNSGAIPELVPAAYNSKSDLLRDVAKGTNKFDFELKSKASRIDTVTPTR